MASIYVEPIGESTGYELRNHLIDLLGSDGDPAGKAYTLKITLTSTNQGVALQNDATITRYNDTLKAAYVLTDAKGATIAQGDLSGLSLLQCRQFTLCHGGGPAGFRSARR